MSKSLNNKSFQSQLNSERVGNRSQQIRATRQNDRTALHIQERFERQLHQRYELHLQAVEQDASELRLDQESRLEQLFEARVRSLVEEVQAAHVGRAAGASSIFMSLDTCGFC